MIFFIIQSQNDVHVPITKVVKTSNHSVPAFASGLGVTLEPSKADTVEPKKNPPEPTKPSTSKQPGNVFYKRKKKEKRSYYYAYCVVERKE